uniref:Lipoprotein n=1 Tax=Streptomyces sp. NBC_00049 TaxID=2903617 RepID=A0AAU2JUH9_9ACTN
MSPTFRRPALAASLLAASVVLLAGCTDGGGGKGKPGAEPALGPVAVNPATSSVSLPMDTYTDSDAEVRRMDAVQARLTEQCMARYGFTYAPPSKRPPAGPGTDGDRHRNLFGAADPAHAAAHGYDADSGVPRPEKPAPPQLSDSASAVLFGTRPGETVPTGPDPASQEEAAAADSGVEVGGQKVPAGGCMREGYRTLYAPTKDSVDLLFSFGLASQAHSRAQEDSRVVAVLKGWSDCMERGGYGGVATPYEVIEKLGLQDDKSGPKAIAVATKDVSCKNEVNLVGVWAAAEAAYQKQLVEEHAETLALYKKQRDARLKLAASLT